MIAMIPDTLSKASLTIISWHI